MAAKGTNAKIEVENTIAEAFGSDFLGTADKKIYVRADDGGDKVVIAITLTCPKSIPEEFENNSPALKETGSFDWSGNSAEDKNPFQAPAAEVSAEDQAKIDDLCKTLGFSF